MTPFWDTMVHSMGSLLIVLDPLGTAAIFTAMETSDRHRRQRWPMAVSAVGLSILCLGTIALIGPDILAPAKLNPAALRIIGGCLLLMIAWRIGCGSKANARNPSRRFWIVVYLLSGPGCMTSVLIATTGSSAGPVPVIAALMLAESVALACLLALPVVATRLPPCFLAQTSRLAAASLACLAISDVGEGLARLWRGP